MGLAQFERSCKLAPGSRARRESFPVNTSADPTCQLVAIRTTTYQVLRPEILLLASSAADNLIARRRDSSRSFVTVHWVLFRICGHPPWYFPSLVVYRS